MKCNQYSGDWFIVIWFLSTGYQGLCEPVQRCDGCAPKLSLGFSGSICYSKGHLQPTWLLLAQMHLGDPTKHPEASAISFQMEIKGLQSGHLSSLFVMAKTPERSFSLCHSVLQFAIWQSQSIACSDRARGVNGEMSAGLGWIKPKSFGVVPGTFLSPSSMRL